MVEVIWPYILTLLIIGAQSVALLVSLLVVIAFLLLADRKIWAAVQMRRGPNVVGPFGLLQSFADLLKFVFKEVVIPAGANKGVFMLAPLVTCVLALSAWAVVPLDDGWVIADINVGILYIFAISSLGVYGVIMGGWASNSKYPFLGALRSAAQMVSYEVSIGFVIITVLLCAGTLNLSGIVEAQNSSWGMLGWYFIPLFPMFIVFFVSALAETNRPPFDLPEAESELVAGLHGRVFLNAISHVYAGRVCLHRPDVRDDDDPVPRRLAAAVQHRAVHVDTGHRLVPDQGLLRLLHVRDGQGDRAAVPV